MLYSWGLRLDLSTNIITSKEDIKISRVIRIIKVINQLKITKIMKVSMVIRNRITATLQLLFLQLIPLLLQPRVIKIIKQNFRIFEFILYRNLQNRDPEIKFLPWPILMLPELSDILTRFKKYILNKLTFLFFLEIWWPCARQRILSMEWI